MSKERLYLFDTTLRDGAQTQGVDFSVEDKRQIALALDGLGLDYVEGGWPGANPTDTAFFAERPPLKTARFTAFGMTKRSGRSAGNDPARRWAFTLIMIPNRRLRSASPPCAAVCARFKARSTAWANAAAMPICRR